MINLSLAAACEIRRLRLKQQQTNLMFRLVVKPGGCSKWYYDMSFEKTVQSGDCVFECHDIQVVIDSESLNYVKGLKLDYSEDLIGGGFRFHNPQATATCGCGNSFDVGVRE
jgi:iron-sulfur cluster assembly protein